MQVTATEAKNGFDSLCAEAKHEPLFVEKASLAVRKKAFEADFSEWIAEQNTLVEKYGIPGADLRPW